MQNVRESSRAQKLEADVAAVNRASIFTRPAAEAACPARRAPRRKSRPCSTIEDRRRAAHAGLAGQMIDQRLTVVMQSADDAGGSAERAIWSSATHRFVVVDAGAAGIESFARRRHPRRDRLRHGGARVHAPGFAGDHEPLDLGLHRPRGERERWRRTVPTGSNPTSTPPPTAPRPRSLPRQFFEGTAPIRSRSSIPRRRSTSRIRNPSGSSMIIYRVSGGTDKLYRGGTISVAPGDSITAYALSISPDHWNR